MKRLLMIAATAAVMFGCAELRNHDRSAYENPFYAKYLNTGSALDQQIVRTMDALRENPRSSSAHNELGQLLLQKGFPQDARIEFERAINSDSRFYPAWYNLGLVRAAAGDDLGARRAFNRTISLKPGHAVALFQMGLLEERRHHNDRAVKLYAKAYGINPQLLDVRVNPRVLDSNLTDAALLQLYPGRHTRQSMRFQGTPAGYQDRQEAPSKVPEPANILPPAAPPTDPSQQPQPPAPAPPATTQT